MAANVESTALKSIIKTIMKKKGYKYQDLARRLEVSVPTVKRILNQDDLSVNRLFSILDWLGLTLAQVGKLSERLTKKEFNEYTEEQELYLLDRPGHLHILKELEEYNSPQEIKKKFNLSEKSLKKYLFDLDRHNFIELLPNDRVKLLNTRIVMFRVGGVLARHYAKQINDVMAEHNYRGILTRDDDPIITHEASIKLLLRPETYKKMQEDTIQLAKKFRNISLIEMSIESPKNLISVIFNYMTCQADIRMQLFGMPKNFD